MERHLASITQQISSLKSNKKRKADRTTSKGRSARGAAAPNKERKTPSEKRRRVTKQKEELPEFTFEQKKDLSERINSLTGDRLNTVVNIIQSSMPNLDGVSWLEWNGTWIMYIDCFTLIARTRGNRT